MAFFRTESLISFFMPRGKNKNRKRNNKTVFPELPKQQVQQSIQIVDEKQDQVQKIDTKVVPKLEQKVELKSEINIEPKSKPKRMTQQEMDALLEIEPEPERKQQIIIKSLEPKQEKIDLNYKIEIPRFNDPGEIWIVPEDYKPKNLDKVTYFAFDEDFHHIITDERREILRNGGFLSVNINNSNNEITLFLGEVVNADKLTDKQMMLLANYQLIDIYLNSFNDEYLKPRNTNDRKWCYLHGIKYPFSNILDRNEKNIVKFNGFFIGYYGEIENDNYNQMDPETKNRYEKILINISEKSGSSYYNRLFQAQHMFFKRTKPEIIHSLFHDLPYWEKNGIPAWRTPLWEIITRYNNCIKFYKFSKWNI